MKRMPIHKTALIFCFVYFMLMIFLEVPIGAQMPPGLSLHGSGGTSAFGRGMSGEKPESSATTAVSNSPSEVHGVTRYSSGLPLPKAEVVITGADVSIDRTTVSAGDGTFEFKNLKPGEYQISARKEGFPRPAVITLTLEAGESSKIDISLGASSSIPASLDAQAPSVSSVPTASNTQGGFLHRFFMAYRDDWNPEATVPPAALPPQSEPARAAGQWPAPVDGPPYPFADWPYGGSVVIGQAWTQASPLMEALWTGSNGDGWKKTGIQIYGWLNAGGNWSSSHDTSLSKYTNSPTSYDEVGNSIQPDQEVVYIERQPDTVQKEHFDWGFRFTGLWGLDYRFTTSKGIFSQQLLGKDAAGCANGTCKEYGFDPVMVYLDLYFPHVGQGMDLRVGRYVSLPDIEAQLAPNNYTYSHSLVYTFDCYTQTGVNATIRLSNHWMVQGGFSPGCDVAPWDKIDRKPTANFCVQYSWSEGGDDVNYCDNSINNGNYAYNNMQAQYITWYHKINKTWHTDTESWYQYEKHTPNIDPGAPFQSASLLETNAGGAFCKNPADVTCFAPEWSIVNYVEKQLGSHNYLSIRNEYFDDIVGQRTGTQTKYSEHLFGWGHWIGSTVLFRPEISYMRSYENPAFDNGTKKNQLVFAGDMIWFF
jgi:hypothetical protein